MRQIGDAEGAATTKVAVDGWSWTNPGQVSRVLSPGSSLGLGAGAGRSARISRRQLVGQTRPASSENVRPGCAAPSNAEGSAAVLGAQWWMRGGGRPTAGVQGPIRRQARARGRARGVGAAESGAGRSHRRSHHRVTATSTTTAGWWLVSKPLLLAVLSSCPGHAMGAPEGDARPVTTDGGGADHRGEGTTSTARECPGGSGGLRRAVARGPRSRTARALR